MTIKRLILGILTVWVVILIASTLIASWSKPQSQSQLSLYQTDLLLYASEWQGNAVDAEPSFWQQALLESNPLENAIQNYQKVRTAAARDLEQATSQPEALSLDSDREADGSSKGAQSQERLVNELDVRLGLLYAANQQTEQALQTWQGLISPTNATETMTSETSPPEANTPEATAQVLVGLWSDPPRLLPGAQQQLQTHLSGWFRYQALQQLYDLQQRQDEWVRLQATEQQRAEQSLIRLVLVSTLNILGQIIGIAVLLIILGRVYWQRRRAQAPAGKGEVDTAELELPASSPNQLPLVSEAEREAGRLKSSVLWPPETTWQVMVLWFTSFFGVSFLGLPLAIQLLGFNPATFDARIQAYSALWSYLTLMGVGFAILYLCLRPFVPQPVRWFAWRGSLKSILWGVGGYWAALPLVSLVSLLNQRLLQNQGGGNPLLEIILQNQDATTVAVLFLMVAGLAPFFEEILFRGFLLTSLTRYLPVWGAVLMSAMTFAIAHLNLSDVLPLTVLGIILGTVYLRSRSLVSVIVLHSLWNTGSFVGLLLLGGALG